MARLIVLSLALALTAPVAVRTQGPPGAPGGAPPTSGVVRKNKAPVSDETLRVRLPRPAEADLANGLHLMVLEDRRVPQITFSLIIPGAGGYADPAARPGLAGAAAAMMREGTATRTSAQISEQLETMAATVNVGASISTPDGFVGGSALSEHFARVFDLAADILLHPSFPDDELARYKQRTRAQLLQQRSLPGFLASERYARAMYGDHPAGRVSLTPESLDQITRGDLVALHKARYVPDHAVLAIAGDVSLAEARALVESKLAGWAKAGTAAPQVTDPPAAGPARHFVRGASELGADQLHRRDAGDQAHRRRLGRRLGDEPRDRGRAHRAALPAACARRRATPTAPTATSWRAGSAATGARRPTCARK